MRLPTDVTLLLGPGGDAEIERIWREERLPVVAMGPRVAEADLEALATATIVVCGAGATEAAALAARLGFRTFLVGDAAPEGVRAVAPIEVMAGARAARGRERWKAARQAPE